MAKTIPLAIAGFSTFIHACMAIFMIYTVIQISVILAEPDVNSDGDNTIIYMGGFIITLLVISLLLEIAALVVSVLLILGIQRERHQYIAPWVYLTGVYTILCFVRLIKGSNALDAGFAIKVIIIILHAAIWYPIFKYWRDLRTRRNPNMPENAMLNVCYTTQTPGTIYNAGPGNWQQGQNGATYYPPPGYGPQVQNEASYYPLQNGDGGQIQPTINPKLANASYPRQMTTAATTQAAENPPSYDKN